MKETDTNIENTADINRAKIRRFCGTIIYQIVILTAVVFATVYSNEVAGWGIIGYSVFMCVALFSFSVIALSKPENVARTVLKRNDNWRETITPSGTARRVIGTVVTVIELGLFFTHGWFFIGTLWAVAELFQYLSVRKIKIAAALIEADEVGLDLEPATGETKLNDEFFTPELNDKLSAVQTELEELDTQLRRLMSHNDGALPPEGSLNRKDYDGLAARRKEVLESIDTIINDAAKDFQQRG